MNREKIRQVSGMISKRFFARLRWVPLPLLVGAMFGVFAFNLDRLIAGDCFVNGKWIGEESGLCSFLYEYGTLPAILLGSVSLVGVLLAVWWTRARRHWRWMAFYAAALILGPGLLVNAVFKENFGRPRPTNVVDFGGEHEFHPVGVPKGPGGGKSFPSGHASMGFFLMAPCFVFAAKRRRLATAFLLLGLVAGLSLGAVRIVQGGHWLSDVIWSGVFVYFVCLFTAKACGFLWMEEGWRRTGPKGYSTVPGIPLRSESPEVPARRVS